MENLFTNMEIFLLPFHLLLWDIYEHMNKTSSQIKYMGTYANRRVGLQTGNFHGVPLIVDSNRFEYE